jgi:RNA polymerase sigma factor (sigma-70 family)
MRYQRRRFNGDNPISTTDQTNSKAIGSTPHPEQQWVDEQALRQGLSRISFNQQEALMLKYRYDMTMQEIAEIFDVSASAVKMRIRRGLAELRRHMADEELNGRET